MRTDSGNPPVSSALFYSLLVIAIVLFSGATLFFAPELMGPRWPWALKPFNARFLGAIYLTEFVTIAMTLGFGRWRPARLAMAQAVTFTVLITAASVIHFSDHFDAGRWITWAWFAVYIGPTLLIGTHLWQFRNAEVPVTRVSSMWRRVLVWQAIVLGLYGIALFVLPERLGAMWPWKLDGFHGQSYSAVFLAGAVGSAILARQCAAVELLLLGASQSVFSFFSILGVIVVDRNVHLVDWSAGATWIWIVAFTVLLLVGLGVIRESRVMAGSR